MISVCACPYACKCRDTCPKERKVAVIGGGLCMAATWPCVGPTSGNVPRFVCTPRNACIIAHVYGTVYGFILSRQKYIYIYIYTYMYTYTSSVVGS